MSTYTTSDHSLSFAANFKSIIVQNANGEVEATFALDCPETWASVQTIGDSYVIESGTRNHAATFAFDTADNPLWEFNFNNNSSRLGGTVIVDLRDIGRYKNSADWEGLGQIEFEIDTTPHFFWFVPGGFALKLYFADCYTPGFNLL